MGVLTTIKDLQPFQKGTRIKILSPKRFNTLYRGHKKNDIVYIIWIDRPMVEYKCGKKKYYTTLGRLYNCMERRFIEIIKDE